MKKEDLKRPIFKELELQRKVLEKLVQTNLDDIVDEEARKEKRQKVINYLLASGVLINAVSSILYHLGVY